MPDSRGKFTLEELLRAKRSEQPEPEFWVRFDRELKAKQKLLIQKQLASETKLEAPILARFFKVGALTATFGAAAVAVYLGFQTPVGETQIASSEATLPLQQKPSFSVAKVQETPQSEVGALKEFSTLAYTSAPRVVVQRAPQMAQTPTRTQIKAIETLASLEDTIQAKKVQKPNTPTVARYQFVSSTGLFETELAQAEELAVEEPVWGLEDAYLLGKYADPLTGSINATSATHSLNDIQHVSFSQIDDALSSQPRRSSRTLDSLSVRF